MYLSIRAFILSLFMLAAVPLMASQEDQIPLARGASPEVIQYNMMLDMVQEANRKQERRTDLEQYDADCLGRICRYGSEKLVGKVIYQTPYGPQTVIYQDD